jgi:hypothetical protein
MYNNRTKDIRMLVAGEMKGETGSAEQIQEEMDIPVLSLVQGINSWH